MNVLTERQPENRYDEDQSIPHPTIDPPPAIVMEIGKATMAWGRLEYVLKLTIKSCLDIGFVEGMQHAESKFKVMEIVNDLKKLLRERDYTDAKLAEIEWVLGQVEDFCELRNDVIHSAWTVHGGQPMMIRSQLEINASGKRQLAQQLIKSYLVWMRKFLENIESCRMYLSRVRCNLPPKR
jgi:hypothetical protein